MPRIPDAEIERIKKETDLAALVRSRGVEFGKHGSDDGFELWAALGDHLIGRDIATSVFRRPRGGSPLPGRAPRQPGI